MAWFARAKAASEAMSRLGTRRLESARILARELRELKPASQMEIASFGKIADHIDRLGLIPEVRLACEASNLSSSRIAMQKSSVRTPRGVVAMLSKLRVQDPEVACASRMEEFALALPAMLLGNSVTCVLARPRDSKDSSLMEFWNQMSSLCHKSGFPQHALQSTFASRNEVLPVVDAMVDVSIERKRSDLPSCVPDFSAPLACSTAIVHSSLGPRMFSSAAIVRESIECGVRPLWSPWAIRRVLVHEDARSDLVSSLASPLFQTDSPLDWPELSKLNLSDKRFLNILMKMEGVSTHWFPFSKGSKGGRGLVIDISKSPALLAERETCGDNAPDNDNVEKKVEKKVEVKKSSTRESRVSFSDVLEFCNRLSNAPICVLEDFCCDGDGVSALFSPDADKSRAKQMRAISVFANDDFFVEQVARFAPTAAVGFNQCLGPLSLFPVWDSAQWMDIFSTRKPII